MLRGSGYGLPQSDTEWNFKSPNSGICHVARLPWQRDLDRLFDSGPVVARYSLSTYVRPLRVRCQVRGNLDEGSYVGIDDWEGP